VKFLFDLFPLILFFVAFKIQGIFVATAVAMGATVLQVGYVLARGRKVSGLQWSTLVIIGTLGSATLVLHDETFIKWKPTVFYWLAGVAFLGGLAFGKNLVRVVLPAEFVLPEPVLKKLCIVWGVFFLALGALNLYVANQFSLDTWATFKVFGVTAMMFVLIVVQAFWIAKYMPDDDSPAEVATPVPAGVAESHKP
jgi:intracellular septation protein